MKKTIQRILALLPLCGFVHAHAGSAGQEKIYVGCYSCCFESNIFMPIPNPNNEGWDVVSKPKNFWLGINKAPTPKSEPIYFIKVKAKLGKAGQFGHMGLANHEIEFTQVLEFREYKESDGVCDIPLPPQNIPDLNFK
jgi:hypothetical protein